jgi:hypothetical protein
MYVCVLVAYHGCAASWRAMVRCVVAYHGALHRGVPWCAVLCVLHAVSMCVCVCSCCMPYPCECACAALQPVPMCARSYRAACCTLLCLYMRVFVACHGALSCACCMLYLCMCACSWRAMVRCIVACHGALHRGVPWCGGMPWCAASWRAMVRCSVRAACCIYVCVFMRVLRAVSMCMCSCRAACCIYVHAGAVGSCCCC